MAGTVRIRAKTEITRANLLDTDLMLLEHITTGQDAVDADRSVKLSTLKEYVTDDLDVNTVGGTGKYIQSISEANGKISAQQGSIDNAPTADSANPVKSGGVKIALDGKINTSARGANNGVASLDEAGKVPISQLPSYVSDVLEYNSRSDFPSEGENGKIYVAKDTNLTYRWSGSTYVEISPSLSLGTTSSTAFAGDRGYALEEAMVPFVGSGSTAEKGLVPKPPTTAGDAKFLCENGTWAIPLHRLFICNTSGRFKELTIPEFADNKELFFNVLFNADHSGDEDDFLLKINNKDYSIYEKTATYSIGLPERADTETYVGIKVGALLTFYYNGTRVRLIGSSLMGSHMRFNDDDAMYFDLWSDGRCRVYNEDNATAFYDLPFKNNKYNVYGSNFVINSKTASTLTVAKVNSSKPIEVVCEGYLW